MSLQPSAESDEADFRNGMPTRMAGWLNIRVGRLARRQPRFVNLYGEVLSFHVSENNLPFEEFDVNGSIVQFSDWEAKKSFRLTIGRRTFTCYCGSFEEMQSWARSLLFASKRGFQHYYTLGSLIAEGTYSRVYYAYDLGDPCKVFAVKVIKKRAHDVQSLERIRRERHVNSVLNHPAIVQAVDMFSTVNKDHLVFEFMRGGTLADLLTKHRRLPESYARVVMRELITALYHLHSKNIVHRDVRPGNIFCSSFKFPMSIALGDFGYANFVSEKRVNHDVLSTMIGVPPYICIDICRGIKYGPLVDMWSAGVVMYEIISGETPFTGRSDHEMIENIKEGAVKFDKPIWGPISADAKRFILQLLQKDPSKRINALAALHHRWLDQPARMAHPYYINNSFPATANANGVLLGGRGSPRDKSTDGGNCRLQTSMFTLSGIPPSTSSQSSLEVVKDQNEATEGSSSLLVMHSSPRSIPKISSPSSLSRMPRLQVTPLVRAIADIGLQKVTSDNPTRMKHLMSSSVVQKQLSILLPYRRKLIVSARAFVAVFRLQSLTRGHSATRQRSLMGMGDIDDVNAFIGRRKKAMEKANEQRRLRDGDRHSENPFRGHGTQQSHVPKPSR